MSSRCQRCGREFVLGDTMYEVKVVMKSGFDGYLRNDLDGDVGRELKQAAEELERSSERAERDVYYEVELTLCYRCRRELEDLLEEYRRFGGKERTVH